MPFWQLSMTQQDLLAIKQRFGIIGNSPLLNRNIEIAVQVARTDLSVLITGESGVGKEHFPKVIHAFSTRKHGPYFAVNCGAIPEGTIDSELFGHEKGAFTDAKAEHKGYFEIADGGTLFLDEVGELPMQTQVRLLRVLETGEYLRMGSSTVRKTNVRVVAATNLNMRQAIEEGRFREDLYYRLNTVEIRVPALRERKEDIPLLFRKFAVDFCNRYQMPPLSLNDEATRMLQNSYWRGNIRQLKNLAEQMSVIEMDHQINADTLRKYLPHEENRQELVLRTPTQQAGKDYSHEIGILYNLVMQNRKEIEEMKALMENGRPLDISRSRDVGEAPSFERPSRETEEILPVEESSLRIEDGEKELIRRALELTEGNRKEAAARLGFSERTLYRKIKEYGLCLLFFVICLLPSCSVSFKLNGANINYQTTHSITIADFPNNAPMVNPNLSNALSEGIRDIYQRQTRLQILRKGGDLELEGSIVGYDLSQGAIGVDSYASESKLTIRVMVRFTNNINPDESFEKTYTAYQTFDSSLLLSDVQDELCATMIKEIADNIYNDTVAKW